MTNKYAPIGLLIAGLGASAPSFAGSTDTGNPEYELADTIPAKLVSFDGTQSFTYVAETPEGEVKSTRHSLLEFPKTGQMLTPMGPKASAIASVNAIYFNDIGSDGPGPYDEIACTVTYEITRQFRGSPQTTTFSYSTIDTYDAQENIERIRTYPGVIPRDIRTKGDKSISLEQLTCLIALDIEMDPTVPNPEDPKQE